MSESGPQPPISPDDPVNKDDVSAGKLLGRMLSLFFMYTVISSLGVIWWTWNSIAGQVQP